jgi:hypothetical protein
VESPTDQIKVKKVAMPSGWPEIWTCDSQCCPASDEQTGSLMLCQVVGKEFVAVWGPIPPNFICDGEEGLKTRFVVGMERRGCLDRARFEQSDNCTGFGFCSIP